jgi:hypothetical protein
MPDRLKSFQETLTEAVSDLAEHGYDSAERVARWTRELRDAAERSLISPESLESQLRTWLASTYTRFVDQGQIYKRHPGIARYTLERIKPHLRSELDRRITASANLIKLNRAESIEKTLRRFQGWATAIPVGGVPNPKRREAKADIRRAMGSLPFNERRVLIDQGAKLIASINEIVARDGGAIAAKWHSNYERPGYQFRPEHKARDYRVSGNVYLVRDSWAHQNGLVRKGKAGYTDEIDQPGEKVYCSCMWSPWIYNLRDLPANMLTAKGRNALAGAREHIAAGLADSEPTIPAGLDEGVRPLSAPGRTQAATSDDLQANGGMSIFPPAKLGKKTDIPIPVDRDHDVQWMFVIAKDASRLYQDRSIPRELTLEGKTFDPTRLGFAHEFAELKKMVELTRAFIAEYGRLPNEQERIAIYKKSHYEAGVPAEREEAKKLGVPWNAWEAWSRGKLSALEHRKVRRPPPDAHVKEAPHCRGWPMENVEVAA